MEKIMNKQEIHFEVTERVNKLITRLRKTEEGDYPFEEYVTHYWTGEAVTEICNKVFEETYKLTKNATSIKIRRKES